MGLQVENIVDIETVKKQVQKLTTAGNFVAGSLPIFYNSSTDSRVFMMDLTAYYGHQFVWNSLNGTPLKLHDNTIAADLLLFDGSDFSIYSTSLGLINITTLRSDVTSLQSGNPQDQTANRVSGTVYQNATGKILYVSVVGTTASDTGNFSVISGSISADNVTFIEIASQHQINAYGAVNGIVYSGTNSIMMVVPPNYYYKVVTGSIGLWYEI